MSSRAPSSSPSLPQEEPSAPGRFGPYGGRYVPETLIPALDELVAAWSEARNDPSFIERLEHLRRDFIGRPTALYLAERLSERVGHSIYLKREDLAHTGAHKINNALGQAVIAKRLGKRRIVAETGAGQHGVATATACARFGLQAVVYMGEEDMRRQRPNVVRMKMLGAEVIPVTNGAGTLKDALNDAIRDWIANVETTHYLIGTAAGPHPYPYLVRRLQAVIGQESRGQMLERAGRLPDAVVACVGGGSNAIGIFHTFRDDPVRLIGVEAGGSGGALHARSLSGGSVSILHGSRSYVLCDDDGQVVETHSISAGLDYPGVGPEHAHLHATGRAEYIGATDEEALVAFDRLCHLEGIIPALETSHALVIAERIARDLGPTGDVLVGLSGRGDKDVDQIAERRGMA